MAWVAGADLAGRSERWLALELQMRFLRRGVESYDYYVIASGANGALPHHETGETTIRAGAPLLTDFGCVVGGYYSDMSRVHLPEDGGEAAEAYEIVRAAHDAVIAGLEAGLPCHEADRLARDVIEAAVRRERFIHRTGHGVGLEIHGRPTCAPAIRPPSRSATSSASSRASTRPAASGSATRTSCTSVQTGRSCSTGHRRGPKRPRGIRVVPRWLSREPSRPGMIDVAFTRADLRAADVAVVVDVLRATSTATQALAAGYRSVLCAESVERALTLRAPGRVLAGERRCVRPPASTRATRRARPRDCRGDELVLATTNGAPAIVAAARHAPVVLVACLLNLDAVIAALEGADVQVVCAGTDGAVALEDVYVAGRICARLQRAADGCRARGGGRRALRSDAAGRARAERGRRGAARRGPGRRHRPTAPRSPRCEAVGRVRSTAPGSRAWLTPPLPSIDAASHPSRRSRRFRGGQDHADARARAHPRRGADHAHRGRRLPPLRPRAAGGARDHAARIPTATTSTSSASTCATCSPASRSSSPCTATATARSSRPATCRRASSRSSRACSASTPPRSATSTTCGSSSRRPRTCGAGWKVQRDCSRRGYTTDEVLRELDRREAGRRGLHPPAAAPRRHRHLVHAGRPRRPGPPRRAGDDALHARASGPLAVRGPQRHHADRARVGDAPLDPGHARSRARRRDRGGGLGPDALRQPPAHRAPGRVQRRHGAAPLRDAGDRAGPGPLPPGHGPRRGGARRPRHARGPRRGQPRPSPATPAAARLRAPLPPSATVAFAVASW